MRIRELFKRKRLPDFTRIESREGFKHRLPEAAAECHMEPGDTVVVRSQPAGPVMTVEVIREHECYPEFVCCIWFDKSGGLHRHWFSATVLIRA